MPETQNYLDTLAGDIGLLVPDCPPDLLRLYALLALVKGEDVTLENVHDAWAAWRAATKPDHPSLIPFGELTPGVQELDAPYRDAIRRVGSPVEIDEPPLPDGEYARVEILGHDSHTGWVTDSTRAGVPVMVIRDWDGLVVAEIPGGSLYRYVPLATPLKRPEPRAAITAGSSGFGPVGWTDEDEDEDTEGRPF